MDKGYANHSTSQGGCGPDGLAAAAGPAECGVCVRIVNDSASLGGRMWRAESRDGLTTRADQRGRAPSEPQT